MCVRFTCDQPTGTSGRVDRLLTGRIGRPVDGNSLRQLVETAIEFRFPNDIPPGHSDGSKSTALLQAGDYLLWWQLLDHANGSTIHQEILLITAETKPDWWEVRNGKIVGPRPELVQEMSDETGKRLVLVTLADFLVDAGRFLKTSVSEDTLQEVREAQVEVNQSALWLADLRESEQVDIYDLPPWRLVELVAHLFREMGYVVLHEGYSRRKIWHLPGVLT